MCYNNFRGQRKYPRSRCVPLAQLDRAFGYDPEGRGFESLRARHKDDKTAFYKGCFFIEKRFAPQFAHYSLKAVRHFVFQFPLREYRYCWWFVHSHDQAEPEPF